MTIPPQNPYPTTEILLLMGKQNDPKAIEHIIEVFKLHEGKVYETAEALGLGTMSLYRIRDASPELAAALEKHGQGRNFDRLTWRGLSLSRSAWAKKLGISRGQFQNRLPAGKRGKALFAPSARSRKRVPSKKKDRAKT